MLQIDFINVGDGDAILLRVNEGESNFTILVDCGRPHVEFVSGSLRQAALNYLIKEHVERIDLMVFTHPHFDHIGGALRILERIPVKRLMALYLPRTDAEWIFAPQSDEKTIVGLCDALNYLNDVVALARRVGTICLEACSETIHFGGLALTFSLPDDELAGRQKDAFDALYSGRYPAHEALYEASKERNCSSLILRASYAGKSVLLTGDSYAAYWEDRGFAPCDILKLPHHGDAKSMTKKLLLSLKPRYAVISCQNDTSQKKERPSEAVMELLTQIVPCVLCTENKQLPSFAASMHDAVRFSIDADGAISCLTHDAKTEPDPRARRG